jgi:hypothetical protein
MEIRAYTGELSHASGVTVTPANSVLISTIAKQGKFISLSKRETIPSEWRLSQRTRRTASIYQDPALYLLTNSGQVQHAKARNCD